MMVDLFVQNSTYSGPARGINNSFSDCDCTHNLSPYPAGPKSETCKYEDQIFLDYVLDAIAKHNVSESLFVFWAAHSVHTPLQVPREFLNMYTDKVEDSRRAKYLSMVRWIDTALSNVTALLASKQMYENTLLVVTADNGGPVMWTQFENQSFPRLICSHRA